jgi:2-polyprenyl-3-methyl-5-hydroxy-6-metoxy-1,4-benzoquinol methylase
MPINTKYRNQEQEIMDDFSFGGNQVEDALKTIALINQNLGGNHLTINGLKKLLKNINRSKKITICDVGCGNGDMLRTIAKYGISNGYNFELIGVDANPFTIELATKISKDYTNISYICKNVLEEKEIDQEFDVTLFTLFLHHFQENEIIEIIKKYQIKSKIGVIVNDLERSIFAYRLFQLVCLIFRINDLPKKDGLLSILKGFKKEDFIDFSKKINSKKQTIEWKWAFRLQWIIYKNK